jgi:hypothetical protein
VLASQSGTPFVRPAPGVEDIAVIAAALRTVLSPAAAGTDASAPAGRWKSQARSENLRD